MRKLVVRGSFRSAGAQIGEAIAADVPMVLEKTIAFIVGNSAIGDLKTAREVAARYLDATRADFPQGIEYLEGLAFAVGLELSDLALISFSEEICTEGGARPEKCSTLAVPTREGWVIGHNEDYEPQYFGKMFTLDLRISGCPRVLSLNYPGHFPCLAGSLSQRGVAILNNSLWPDAVPGLSKNVQHFRAAMADDFDGAVKALARQTSALTGHYTVADGPEDALCGLEVSNVATAKSYVHLEDAGRDPYWHTNHVRFLELHRPDPASGGNSVLRGQRLEAMIAAGRLPTSPEGMLDLLSSNDGLLHRTPEQDATSVTLATVVIRPKTGEMWIRDADPTAAVRDLHLHFGRTPRN